MNKKKDIAILMAAVVTSSMVGFAVGTIKEKIAQTKCYIEQF